MPKVQDRLSLSGDSPSVSANPNVLFDDGKNALFCVGASVPSAKPGYAVGCTLVLNTNGAVYRNTGTTASCTFTTVGTISAASVTGAMLTSKVNYSSVAVTTTGATPVNVFGAGGAPVALTLTSVLVLAKETTAANITVKQAANTVCTVAKSQTAGAVVGAVSLSNATYAPADVCTVVSSAASPGDAIVIMTFTVA
jgi:hypothetical protein